MSVVYKADGSSESVAPEGKTFTLTQMQKIVGGLIEIVRLKDGTCLIINEEGKLVGLDYNAAATKLAREVLYGDYIVGDALHCKANQIK